MPEEAHSAPLAPEEQTESHAPENLGEARIALRALRSLLKHGLGNRFGLELNRLVAAWHQAPPLSLGWRSPPTP
jgi:hypothetical protein